MKSASDKRYFVALILCFVLFSCKKNTSDSGPGCSFWPYKSGYTKVYTKADVSGGDVLPHIAVTALARDSIWMVDTFTFVSRKCEEIYLSTPTMNDILILQDKTLDLSVGTQTPDRMISVHTRKEPSFELKDTTYSNVYHAVIEVNLLLTSVFYDICFASNKELLFIEQTTDYSTIIYY